MAQQRLSLLYVPLRGYLSDTLGSETLFIHFETVDSRLSLIKPRFCLLFKNRPNRQPKAAKSSQKQPFVACSAFDLLTTKLQPI